MATWKSGACFPFRRSHETGDGNWRWEYRTASDALSLIRDLPKSEDAYGHGEILARCDTFYFWNEEAQALYKAMRHWLLRYEGERILARLDDEVDRVSDLLPIGGNVIRETR